MHEKYNAQKAEKLSPSSPPPRRKVKGLFLAASIFWGKGAYLLLQARPFDFKGGQDISSVARASGFSKGAGRKEVRPDTQAISSYFKCFE